MNTVTPVTIVGEDAPTGALPDLLQAGCRITEHIRLDRLLERGKDWALYLGDDEEAFRLVLMAVANSTDALERCLSGPAAGVVVRRTTFKSFDVAEVQLEEHHFARFRERLEQTDRDSSGNRTLASPSAPSDARLPSGSIFANRYRVDGLLGRGGMGEVYRAFDDTFQRAVALKVVRVNMSEGTTERRDEAKRRLLNEARVVSTLKHPHIVEIYDAGESAGLPYLVLELCEGGNLRKAMAERASHADRLRWITEIAEALAHAHEQGIVHRDVKPENVILTSTGTAKVADFGIAKALNRERSGSSTLFGMVGTPQYMAPEQFLGATIDARADQYAWGLVAYELLTGAHWRSRELKSSGDSDSITSAPIVPTNLRPILARAVANAPEARYEDFRAVLQDIRRPRPRQKRRWVLGATAAFLIIAAGVAMKVRRFDGGDDASATARNAVGNGDSVRRNERPEVARSGSPFAKAATEDSIHPEARAAYDAAVQLWTDASPQDALVRLQAATDLDSSFARAHLLYALIDDVTAGARQHYQVAAQHRAKLSDRERDLLEALAPSLQDPLDVEETRRRLERLEQQLPDDPDIPLFIASRYLLAWDGKRALPIAERAISVSQPPRPVARLMRARALAKLNRLDEARTEYTECFASSPSATGCLRWNAKLEAGSGRCENVERLGRRLIAAAPQNPDGYFFLAGGLAGQSAPDSALRAALGTRWQVSPPAIAPWLRAEETFYLQMSAGAFDQAERTLDTWEAEGLHFTDADHRGAPAVQRLLLNLELSRNSKTAALARSYLDQSRAWTEGGSIVFDIEAYRVLYFTGAISRAEFARFRDNWLTASEHRRKGRQDMALYRWYEAFVEPVVDADDARLALSHRPPDLEPDRELMHAQAMQRFGRMYLLAGHVSDALTYLRMSTEACYFKYPIHRLWAHLDYAKVLNETGDSTLALKSLDAILHQWAGDPRSKTIREARDLAARIRSRKTQKEQ